MIIITFIINKQTNKRNIQKITRDGTKEKTDLYLQPIITQYFIDNKSEIWLLFLIAHSKR